MGVGCRWTARGNDRWPRVPGQLSRRFNLYATSVSRRHPTSGAWMGVSRPGHLAGGAPEVSWLVSFVQCAGRVKSARLPALLTTWMLLAVPGARAEPYAAGLSITREEDLRALFEDGVLPEEDFETLRELLRTGVDVRTAPREALYALPGLTWAQVDALLAYRERVQGAFTPE